MSHKGRGGPGGRVAAPTLGPQRAPHGLVTPCPQGACDPATLSPPPQLLHRPLPALLTGLASSGLLEGSGQRAPLQGAPDSRETPHAGPSGKG